MRMVVYLAYCSRIRFAQGPGLWKGALTGIVLSGLPSAHAIQIALVGWYARISRIQELWVKTATPEAGLGGIVW